MSNLTGQRAANRPSSWRNSRHPNRQISQGIDHLLDGTRPESPASALPFNVRTGTEADFAVLRYREGLERGLDPEQAALVAIYGRPKKQQ